MIRIINLPWTFTTEDIENLFPNYKVHVLTMQKDGKGRFSGKAFIVFKNEVERDIGFQMDLTHINKFIKKFKV